METLSWITQEIITGALIRGRQEGKCHRRCDNGSRGGSVVTTSQGMQAASGGWKRQGTDSPLESPEETQTC